MILCRIPPYSESQEYWEREAELAARLRAGFRSRRQSLQMRGFGLARVDGPNVSPPSWASCFGPVVLFGCQTWSKEIHSLVFGSSRSNILAADVSYTLLPLDAFFETDGSPREPRYVASIGQRPVLQQPPMLLCYDIECGLSMTMLPSKTL